MSEYLGTVGGRMEAAAKLTGVHTFEQYFSWRPTEVTIYTMEDADGNVLVWKTSAVLGMDKTNPDGTIWFDGVRKGDTFTFKATVKEHSEYKGTRQTVLTRVKVSSVEHGPTKEERDAAKAEAQKASLQGEDFIWEMPYKQYKEHYSDCETVAGSFRERYDGKAVIEVIIREGRLVPNGTRGRHYKGFQFEAQNIGKTTYYAISEETARRRLLKDFPETSDADWELVHIFVYHRWED